MCLDAEGRVFSPGFVAVEAGRIAGVGPMAQCPAGADNVIDADDCLVLPGFVNSHTHLVQSLIRGLGDEMPPGAWLGQIVFPLSRFLTRERAYHGARLSLLELVRSGVTTTADCHFTNVHGDALDGVLQALRESRVLGVVARGSMDGDAVPAYAREDTAVALREVDRIRAAWESQALRITLEPLGPHRCSERMLRDFHDYARRTGVRMHLHLASSRAEAEWARTTHGCGAAEYVDRLGLLDDRVLAAHCVHLADREVTLLARRGVPVSHNPASNAILGYGIFPLTRFLAAGGLVGLGVDGAGSNNGQNMFESMKMAMLFQKALLQDPTVGSAALALDLATRASARALEVDAVAGSLEVGKRADLIAIPVHQAHLAPFEGLVSNLVYAGTATRVRTVMIGGEVVLRDDRHVLFDEGDVIEQAGRAQMEIIAEARGAGIPTPWATDPARSGSRIAPPGGRTRHVVPGVMPPK
jgi:5-methylthioadenosine/S-adenosylhomocysteine deaminase